MYITHTHTDTDIHITLVNIIIRIGDKLGRPHICYQHVSIPLLHAAWSYMYVRIESPLACNVMCIAFSSYIIPTTKQNSMCYQWPMATQYHYQCGLIVVWGCPQDLSCITAVHSICLSYTHHSTIAMATYYWRESICGTSVPCLIHGVQEYVCNHIMYTQEYNAGSLMCTGRHV